MIRLCPEHRKPLQAMRTKYGTRYWCQETGCTVRCWGNRTSTPCDQETADLRRRCHELFDPLWKGRVVFMNRKSAYRWLCLEMNLLPNDCHFGMFTAEQCRQALDRIQKRFNQ